MTWWQILLIVLSIPVTYYIYVSATGKKRRKNIFYAIIRDTYLQHKSEALSLDIFHYEAAEKFASEHGGHVIPGRASVSIPLLDNEE